MIHDGEVYFHTLTVDGQVLPAFTQLGPLQFKNLLTNAQFSLYGLASPPHATALLNTEHTEATKPSSEKPPKVLVNQGDHLCRKQFSSRAPDLALARVQQLRYWNAATLLSLPPRLLNKLLHFRPNTPGYKLRKLTSQVLQTSQRFQRGM